MTATAYVIISTKKSEHYTQLAVDSFLQTTKLHKDDEFYLIDNDNTGKFNHVNAQVINNSTPLSFSKNINNIIGLAENRDVVVLNNDIVFTPGWAEPLKSYSNAILLPCCNQTHTYASGDLIMEPTMTIDQYTSAIDLANVVQQHKQTVGMGFFESILMPFFAFRLPYNVYSKVGLFDETFGVGGGEDVDYRLRAIEKGFSVKYVKQSYLLHFHGKSTWDNGEDPSQTQLRNDKYKKTFTDKWSKELTDLLLVGGDANAIVEKYKLMPFIQQGDFTGLIRHLLLNNLK
jgi:GT2 family glycosyltransferase